MAHIKFRDFGSKISHIFVLDWKKQLLNLGIQNHHGAD